MPYVERSKRESVTRKSNSKKLMMLTNMEWDLTISRRETSIFLLLWQGMVAIIQMITHTGPRKEQISKKKDVLSSQESSKRVYFTF
jgi:ABC-type enterobactin transport system permease subunit